MKFQLSIPSWNFKPGWKSPHNQPLNIKTFVNEPAMVVIFEPDLPCFWIGPSVFWLSPSRVFFWVGPPLLWLSFFLLLSQSFPFLSQSFRVFCQSFSFFESVLPDFKSPTFPVNASYFLTLTYHISMMSVSPSHALGQSFPFFFTAYFLLFPVLRFDLITMCTVDKIKDEGVCRKRLLH